MVRARTWDGASSAGSSVRCQPGGARRFVTPPGVAWHASTGQQREPAPTVRPMDDAAERAVLADAARGLRAVLAELADPDSELTAPAATRRRIEGAAVALNAVVQRGSAEGTEPG